MQRLNFTKMIILSLSLIVSILINPIYSAHFRGGAISWRPAINTPSVLNTVRTIIIDQRYAWSKSAAASACTTATILSFGLIGEASVSQIKCLSPSLTCTNAQYPSNLSKYAPCTDYNTLLGMSYGYTSTSVNLTVISSGIVLGYVVTGAWLHLQLGGGGWSMITYINMEPRPDNNLINSSPTSDLPPINYVPAGANLTTSINIPMSDADGDDIECRFAQSSNTFSGVTVNECSGVCKASALPVLTQLISGNNTCTLIVSLPSIGYYAVAIQLEDFLENSTTLLSSVPLQFLLLAYDDTNPTSTCTLAPIIISIPPDLPVPGSTVTVQVTILYTAMVIAQTGCVNDTDTSISNFITSSPPGMLKTNLPFALVSPSYAVNLTWTPTIDQLGKTFPFCVTAIDSNYYSSSQYCFNFFVGPKTTTTTTTTTSTSTTETTSTTSSTSSTSITSTSTTSISTTLTTSTLTTATQYNYIPLVTGLSLGLGLPLLLLLSLLSLCYLCRWCPKPLRSCIRNRFTRQADTQCPHCQKPINFDDAKNQNKSAVSDDARRFRQQYIRNHDSNTTSQPTTAHTENELLSSGESFASRSLSPFELGFITSTTTSFISPSTTSFPMERISRIACPPRPPLNHHSSILVRAYSRQIQPI